MLAREHRGGYDTDGHDGDAGGGPVGGGYHTGGRDGDAGGGPVRDVDDPGPTAPPVEVDLDREAPTDADLELPPAGVVLTPGASTGPTLDDGQLPVDPAVIDAGGDLVDHDVRDDVSVAEDSIRDAAQALVAAARRMVALATDAGRARSGELAALTDTLAAIEQSQAAAVELAGQAQAGGAAARKTGLPMEHWLAMNTRLPAGERRGLLSTAEQLPTMPWLKATFETGQVGYRQVRAILNEIRGLDAEARARVDAGFGQIAQHGHSDPDRLLDEVAYAAARERPEREAKDTARQIERRFLVLQPMLDGAGGSGYFELDDEGFTTVAEGLEAAMPPPSAGPRDVTTHAVGHADPDDDAESETADGDPAFCDPVADRSRARARADALVALAETFLSGTRADGTVRRARPRIQALIDLRQAVRPDDIVGWLLAPTIGRNVAVTAEAARRLSSDADLQLIVTDRDQIVGVSAPVATIPARVRAAVQARDRGCRFPACRLPVQFTDCHHVTARHNGGHTVVSNLVALCRRHHVAVTEGRWKLTMTDGGTVTVTRGRHTHTSDPPEITPFNPPDRNDPNDPNDPSGHDGPDGPDVGGPGGPGGNGGPHGTGPPGDTPPPSGSDPPGGSGSDPPDTSGSDPPGGDSGGDPPGPSGPSPPS